MNKKEAIKIIKQKFPKEEYSYGDLNEASSFDHEMSDGKPAIRVKYKDGREKLFKMNEAQNLNG